MSRLTDNAFPAFETMAPKVIQVLQEAAVAMGTKLTQVEQERDEYISARFAAGETGLGVDVMFEREPGGWVSTVNLAGGYMNTLKLPQLIDRLQRVARVTYLGCAMLNGD